VQAERAVTSARLDALNRTHDRNTKSIVDNAMASQFTHFQALANLKGKYKVTASALKQQENATTTLLTEQGDDAALAFKE